MNNDKWDRAKLLQTSSRYWLSCVIHAAVKLDVFTAIGNDSLSAESIARQVETNIDSLERLLDALSAMKLLNKQEDIYTNTGVSREFLSKDSPNYIGYIIMHHHHLMESWFLLDQAVATGCSVRDRATISEEENREYFLMGMFNTAMNIAPGLSDTLELTGRRSLLDMGGGPGTYAIHFCLKNPDLTAVIYDFPSTRPFAEKTVERFGLSDRIHFQAGDIVTDPIEGEYDVVWVSHLLHSEGPDSCQAILEKVAKVIRPGGMILIHEFILDDTRDRPLYPAIFSLNMLVRTDKGRSYSETELTGMLERAGFTRIKRLDFVGPTESGILKGTIEP